MRPDQEPLTLPTATPGEGEANLPAVAGGADLEEMVYDGEVVDEPETRPAVYVLRPVVNVFQTVNVVARHPHTRVVARHVSYVAVGMAVAARRRRRRLTFAQRMAELEAARGNGDKALEWARQHHAHVEKLAERRQRAWETFVHLMHPQTLKGVAIAAGAVAVLLAMTGWMRYLVGLYHLASTVAALAWDVRYGVPAAALLWLWHLGRRAGDLAPKWAVTAADADVDITIDERSVSQALANLRIPQIRDYLAKGHPLQFPVMCRQEGRGTGFEVRLPGVAAEQVIRRRVPVAAGLHRLPKETWLSVGGDASILRGWIADKGALEEGAGEYPLLNEGFCDVFKGGVPFGRSLKGDPKKEPVIGRNSIDGGMPEQGKSNGARVVACGYTLDLITELRIYVPDTNFDFEAFKPRCSRYLMGAEDEVIEAMLEEQELLKEELQRRGQLLVDYGVQEVTREIAHAGVGLHPVLALVEEAHVPITHKKHGKDFAQLLGENVKLDRKRGVHIKVSTQAPVRGAMPRDVTTNCTVGVAYALADIYANDAILGPGAHSAGHRATELIPGTDRGIALCKGFEGEARSEMIQAYRVDTGQVPAIVARSMAELARRGKPVPGTERGPLAIVSRDLLADLSAVLAHRSGKVRVADLPPMLRNLAKTWGPYRTLNGLQLRAELTELGVRTTKPENVPTLDPEDLRQAISAREDVG